VIWTDKLLAYFKVPAEIIIHENRTTYLRVETWGGRVKVHLHRLFAEAPSPVWEAIARYSVRRDRKALALIRQMANLYFSTHRIEAPPLEEKGSVYDLGELYERVKKRYFQPDYQASIGWSNRKSPGAFRFVTFGSYDRQLNQIRINPLLDHPDVPLYFIEFIVYHEMLHGVCLPVIDRMGRARVHTAEFKEQEKLFAEFGAAKEWEKKSLMIFKKRKRIHGRA
jgi:hypothetical protein